MPRPPGSTWGMSGYLAEERRRERIVCTLPCPVCNAAPYHQCDYPMVLREDGKKGGSGSSFAHAGRYDLAAKQGLVPPLGDHAAEDDVLRGDNLAEVKPWS